MKNLTKNTQLVYLYKKQDGKCAYCKEILIDYTPEGLDIRKQFNIDHIIPKSRGGSEDISNLALSCNECNSAKANMTADEYEVVLEKVKSGLVQKSDIYDYAKYLVLKSKFEKNGTT